MSLFLTRNAIIQAITWMRSQTLPDSISNGFLGDLLESMVDETPDFSQLTNIELRQLKTGLDKIQTGNFQIQDLGTNFPQANVKVKISQQGYEDQILTGVKGNYVSMWAYGEAPYHLTLAEDVVGGTLPLGRYYFAPAPNNQSYLFGGNLGGLPAGYDFLTTDSGAQIQFSPTDFGVEAHRVPLSVTFHNNTSAYGFINFAMMSSGELRKEFTEGVTASYSVIDTYNTITPLLLIPSNMGDGNGYWYPANGLKVKVLVNGVEITARDYDPDQGIGVLPSFEAIYVNNVFSPNDDVQIILEDL